jgi:hypothetical protein
MVIKWPFQKVVSFLTEQTLAEYDGLKFQNEMKNVEKMYLKILILGGFW